MTSDDKSTEKLVDALVEKISNRLPRILVDIVHKVNTETHFSTLQFCFIANIINCGESISCLTRSFRKAISKLRNFT